MSATDRAARTRSSTPSNRTTLEDGRRRLGGSDLHVGRIAYGCWRLTDGGLDEARSNLDAALEAGWDLIDTADIYGFDGSDGFGTAEELLGRVLADDPAMRDRIVLATKGGISPRVPYDWSPTYLRTACEDSLRRLGVDVIDLYQLHRPDLLTHPESVAATLMELHSRGLVREFGLSNVTPSQVVMIQSYLDRPLVSNQPELSIWHSDPVRDGTLDQCIVDDMTPLAWSPLGGGRFAPGDGAGDRVASTLGSIAADRGVDAPAVALAFVLAHPSAPIPILGTQRPERILAARDALGVELTRTEWYDLYQAGNGERLP